MRRLGIVVVGLIAALVWFYLWVNLIAITGSGWLLVPFLAGPIVAFYVWRRRRAEANER
jgi:hypothetical protein